MASLPNEYSHLFPFDLTPFFIGKIAPLVFSHDPPVTSRKCHRRTKQPDKGRAWNFPVNPMVELGHPTYLDNF